MKTSKKIEIEIKFILKSYISDRLIQRSDIEQSDIEQIYLDPDTIATISDFSRFFKITDSDHIRAWRIRRIDNKYIFTAKTGPSNYIEFDEYETEINRSIFLNLKSIAAKKGPLLLIRKTRRSFYALNRGARIDIDEYHEVAGGLCRYNFVTCEVEALKKDIAEKFQKRDFSDKELIFLKSGVNVTGIKKFSNHEIARQGFVSESYSGLLKWVKRYQVSNLQ